MEELKALSSEYNLDIQCEQFSKKLDELDELKSYREQFIIPKKSTVVANQTNGVNGNNNEKECIYLCSNSLGLQPKELKTLILEELQVWAEKGVIGHHQHNFNRPWVTIDEHLIPMMSKIIGAKQEEVAIMATLTSNLHFLITSFYQPTKQRYKILIEDKAFPSDHYAVLSQMKLKGIDSEDSLILLKPREGETTLNNEDIINTIKLHGNEINLILLPGVQYYTGQVLDIKKITEIGHEMGCIVGFDLAHAVGNIELKLNEWNVDFACWCTYKYLCSGPGNIGGLFVHEKYSKNLKFPRLTGWWSHDLNSRFEMDNNLELISGASGFRHSNPSVLSCISLLSSLKIFDSVGMDKFINKSKLITNYLEYLILNDSNLNQNINIITPKDQKGCQLSLIINKDLDKVFNYLLNNGIVVDERKPNCIRVAPFPLINSFNEIFNFINILKLAIKQ